MTGNFQFLMHFPTSLPRSSGSPSASVQRLGSSAIGSVQDVHSIQYDGPALPGSGSSNPKSSGRGRIVRGRVKSSLELRRQPRSRPTIPVFAVNTPPKSSLKPPTSHEPRPSSVESLRSKLPIPMDSSVRPLQGPTSSLPAGLQAGSRRPEFKKMFSRKAAEPERPPTPTDAAELQTIKQMLRVKTDTPSEPSSVGSGKVRGSRARLAAHFSRAKEKRETGAGMDPQSMDTIEDAKARLAEVQRRRKMRRAGSTSTKSPDTEESTPAISMQDISSDDEIHGSFHMRTGQVVNSKVPTVQDRLEAHREARELEKCEVEDGGLRDRIGNLAKRLSTTFSISQEDRDAGSSQKPSRTFQSLDDRAQRNSPLMESAMPSGPLPPPLPHGYDQLEETELHQNAPLDLQYEEEALFMERYLNQPDFQMTSEQYYIHEPPRNQYMQVMYPPRPQGAHFRPTLSPVSSHSAVPTNQLGSNHPRTRPSSAIDSSIGRLADPASSARHRTPPKDHAQISNASEHARQKKSPDVSRSVSTASSADPVASRIPPMAPILEGDTASALPRKGPGRRPSHALETEKDVNSGVLDRASISKHGSEMPGVSAKHRLRPKLGVKLSRPLQSSLEVQRPEQKSPQISLLYRPDSISPVPTPTPLNTSARSPTASALEFWQEADESLHPSESASAQPPNYRGECPPEFWKLADATLRRRDEPTMEEWISSLPGLGLALGPYGTHDGALDLKVFDTLKAKRKLQKSRPSSAASRRTAAKSVVDELIDQSIRETELALADADESADEARELARMQQERDGLTPGEAEALKALDVPEELIEEIGRVMELNSTPPVADPRLLHPMYTPGSATRRFPPPALVTDIPCLPSAGLKARPSSRLGKDVASRLDALEKYWEEQSVVMGTVLKRMLVVVDNLMVKEREEAQRRARMVEMGWADSDYDDDDEEEEEEEELEEQTVERRQGLPAPGGKNKMAPGDDEWGCSVA